MYRSSLKIFQNQNMSTIKTKRLTRIKILRLVKMLLNILRALQILCSFRLVKEWKEGEEIPHSQRLEFSEKISAYNYALSGTEKRNSRATFVESTIGNSPTVTRVKFLRGDRLFCFVRT